VRRGLQIGFGELVDPAILDGLRSLDRLRMARIKVGRDKTETEDIVHQAVLRGWRPLVIVAQPRQVFWLPADCPIDVELMSEPDIGTENEGYPVGLTAYRLAISEAYGAVWSRRQDGQDIRLWVGAISNFTPRAFDYLSEILTAAPSTVGVSAHWYPYRSLRGAHRGYSSREQELAVFLSRIGNRPWGISETGWHTAPQHLSMLPWAPPVAWSDLEVAGAAEAEFTWWESAGAKFAVLYQLNDGPTANGGDRFGIRRIDGSLKPVAGIFR
jgi:hypothetical protein